MLGRFDVSNIIFKQRMIVTVQEMDKMDIIMYYNNVTAINLLLTFLKCPYHSLLDIKISTLF